MSLKFHLADSGFGANEFAASAGWSAEAERGGREISLVRRTKPLE
jgi:hypothetical protein